MAQVVTPLTSDEFHIRQPRQSWSCNDCTLQVRFRFRPSDEIGTHFFKSSVEIMHGWVASSFILLASVNTSSCMSSAPPHRALRKVNIETPPGGAGDVTFGSFGAFCIICAMITPLCGCCEEDEGKKKQSYRGSALCFVIGLAVVVVTAVLFEEDSE